MRGYLVIVAAVLLPLGLLFCTGDLLDRGGEKSNQGQCGNISGTDHGFLVSELRIPISAAEAQGMAFDLDGDGEVDNKLGQILAIFVQGGADPNGALNQSIVEGDLRLGTRVRVDAFPTDDLVAVQVFEAALITPAPPLFDGGDIIGVAAGVPPDQLLCGEMVTGGLTAFSFPLPGAEAIALTISLPLPGVAPVSLTANLSDARIAATVDATTINELVIGGGITPQEVDANIIPAVATFIAAAITADPNGSVAQATLPIFDGVCDDATTNPVACQTVTPGVGPCALDAAITETEMRCNAGFNAAIGADVDSDGDGVADLLSVGFRLEARAATIQ